MSSCKMKHFFVVIGLICLVEIVNGQPACPLAQYDGQKRDLRMVSHQARGVIEIFQQNCSFSVSKFEVVGFEGMQWWAADALDLDSFVNGVSLGGQSNLQNDVFHGQIQVSIPQDKWQDLQSMTVLALWIPSEARLVGYNLLNSNDSAPTMYEHCIKHTETSQLRWRIVMDAEKEYGDFAIEGQISPDTYHSVGFPPPGARNRVMGGSDAIVYGLIQDKPFALDYFLKSYFECAEVSPGVYDGVCSDSQFGESGSNVQLTYSQFVDGTWLINARRFLISDDTQFDTNVNPFDDIVLIWAVSRFVLDDQDIPSLQYHGLSYGEPLLNLLQGESEEELPECTLLYDSLAVSTGSSNLIEDTSSPLQVTLGPKDSLNPLQGEQVLYVNGLPSPTILVTTTDDLVFDVSAGINFAVTTSPIGGSYAQPASVLTQGTSTVSWSASSATDENIYYQSLDDPLVGGRILVKEVEVGDIGEYDFSVQWDSLIVQWIVQEGIMSWSVESTKSVGWICIGFGSKMTGGYAYVGWIGDDGEGLLRGYYMRGQSSGDVYLDEDAEILGAVVEKDGVTNRLKMTFSRPFETSSVEEPDVGEGSVSMIWAHGSSWRLGALLPQDTHLGSRGVEIVNLLSGETKAPEIETVWLVHGIFMFVGWSVLVPMAIMTARFFKAELGPLWMQIHKACNISGLVLGIIASALAIKQMSDNGSEHFETDHTKLGLATMVIGIYQGIQGFIRPPKPGPDGTRKEALKRKFWGLPHVFVGFSLIILSHAAIITGLQIMEKVPGAGEMWRWEVSVYVWLGLLGLTALAITAFKVYNAPTEKVEKKQIVNQELSAQLPRPLNYPAKQ